MSWLSGRSACCARMWASASVHEMEAPVACPTSAVAGPSPPRVRRAGLLGLVLVAVLVRGLLLAHVAHEPRKLYTPDSTGYHVLAHNLLRHGVFSGSEAAPFAPATGPTPGYPVFVSGVFALAGESAIAVALLQIALAGATVVVTVWLAGRLGVSPGGATLAGLVVALEPVSVLHTVLLLTETLFTLVLIGGLALLAWHLHTGSGWALVAGALLLGAATLSRPITLYLPLLLLPVLLTGAVPARRWILVRRGLAFLLVAALLPAAWAARNYREAGVFTVSTIGSAVLYYHVAATVLAAERGITQREAVQELRRIAAPSGQERTGSQAGSEARATAVALLVRSPLRTAGVLVRGASRLLVDPGYTQICTLLDPATLASECFPGRNDRLEPGVLDRVWARTRAMSGLQQGTLALGLLVLGVTYLGSLAGIVALGAYARWRTLAFLVVPVAYFIALSAVPADSRFRIPTVPLLGVLAGFGWDWVRRGGAPDREDSS